MNFSHSALFHMKTGICLKHFAHDCSFIPLSYKFVLVDVNNPVFHVLCFCEKFPIEIVYLKAQ